MNAIEATGLTKRYKNVTAVDNLNLSIRQGELFSLLGVNGAGKTTAVKMLSCLAAPTAGDALLLGDSIVSAPQKVKEKANISPQETAVARSLTVFENLAMTAALYGCKKDEANKRANEFLEKFELSAIARKKAKTLSGGQQRKLSIAMALISEPQILFLDEPTLGLDVLARRELWKIIEELKGKITVMLTTHYMEEAEALSDRIGIMVGGKLIVTGTAAELIQNTGAKTFEDAFVAYATKKDGETV